MDQKLFFLFYQQVHKTTKTNPDKQLSNISVFSGCGYTHWRKKITGYQRDLYEMKRKTKEGKTNPMQFWYTPKENKATE